MHFARQCLDTFAHLLRDLGQFGILLEQGDELIGLSSRLQLAFLVRRSEVFAMPRIGVGIDLVAICLARLRKQNQRRGVSGLETKGKV
jgi:hypothetical protein